MEDHQDMEGLREQLVDEKEKLTSLQVKLNLAEVEMGSIGPEVEARCLQFDIMSAELFELRRGKSSTSC